MREYFVWLAKFFTTVVIVVFVAPLLLAVAVGAIGAASSGKHPSIATDKKVAVVELTGVIEDSKEVVNDLYKQADDDSIKGIVLRINSPGGAVGPSQEIFETVKKLKAKKPIIAVMEAVAASGGFYSALGASKIFAQPGTLTGSIGVIMQIPNVEKLADWAGVKMITIKSGAMKDVGNTFRTMTPEEQAYLEETARDVHAQFISAVSDARNIAKTEVLKWGDGRVILGQKAKELGIVDAFGGVHDGARAVFEELGSPLPADEDRNWCTRPISSQSLKRSSNPLPIFHSDSIVR